MITQEQRLARADKIGSSDAAAILGLDPYRSAADVYLEKTGQAAGFEGNDNTDRGELLEPAIIEYAMRELGWAHCGRDRMFTHASGLLVSNLDACAPDNGEIIEAKTTVDPTGWGQDGTDEVPERVLAQVHHQFVCVPSARVAWVPVLMPGFKKFDFRLYKVARNDELCAAVEQQGLDFMRNHVLPRVQPSDFRPSLEVLKRVRRTPSKIVPVADELVERYLAATAAKKTVCDDCEKAQSYLLAAMGDAEGATWSGGSITYFEVNRKEFVTAASTYRQLRVKQSKKAVEP